MINRIEYDNGEIVLSDNATEIGRVPIYEKKKYSEIPVQKKHTAREYTSSEVPIYMYTNGSIAFKDYGAYDSVIVKRKNDIITSLRSDVQNPFLVPSFNQAVTYVENYVVSIDKDIYYLKRIDEYSKPTSHPNKFEIVSNVTEEDANMFRIGSTDIKPYRENVFSYINNGSMYFYDFKKNYIFEVCDIVYGKKSLSVFKEKNFAYISTDSLKIIVSNEDDINVGFQINSIITSNDEFFVVGLDGKLYRSDYNKYNFSEINNIDVSNKVRFSILNNILMCENIAGDTIYFIDISTGFTRSVSKQPGKQYIQLDDATILKTDKAGASVQKKIKILVKPFCHISTPELFKINGRKEYYRIIDGFSSTHIATFQSDKLVSLSSAIVNGVIYTLNQDETISKTVIPAGGMQDVNSLTDTVNSNIPVAIGTSSLYGYKDRLYQLDSGSSIIRYNNVNDMVYGQIDLTGVINGIGIQSMYINGGLYDEYTILTVEGTCYTINISDFAVLSTFNVEGRTYRTDIVEFFDRKILATNLYAPTRAIYEVDNVSGKKAENASILLPFVSGYNTTSFRYNDTVIAYNGIVGEYFVYPRKDILRRVN